jgi:cyclopropane fatty-acyl-phospholipid synthase-like methyltransferase
MAERVCPWWAGYLLASPIRRWMQNPETLLGRYIEPGMTILEPGPAMGFFTLPMAQMAGPAGRVVAVDIQPKMIDGLRRRAAKAGLSERVDARLAQTDSLGIDDLKGKVDFVLAFGMVHEVPSAENFFREAASALKADGQLLLAEPEGHVNPARFAKEMDAARRAGLVKLERVAVRRSHAALFEKKPA